MVVLIFFLKMQGAGKTGQQLRALPFLAENQDPVPSLLPHGGLQPTLTLVPGV